MERIKHYTSHTKKIVDNSYDNWINAKNLNDNILLQVIADQIYLTYKGKHSDYQEIKEYWFEKFKDEKIIINKLNGKD